MSTSNDLNVFSILFALKDHGIVASGDQVEMIPCLTRWPEQLHDSDAATDTNLLDGS